MQFITCCCRVEGLQPLDVLTETHGQQQAYIPVLHTCHLRRLGYWWYLMWMIACRTLLFHIPLLRSLLTCFGYIISPCLESKAMHSHYHIQKYLYYIQLAMQQSRLQFSIVYSPGQTGYRLVLTIHSFILLSAIGSSLQRALLLLIS